MGELKPCPFCGQKAKLVYREDNNEFAAVQCDFCWVKTIYLKKEAVIKAWNRRVNNG